MLAVVAVVAATGLCLWLFFRPGSVSDRARDDEADADLTDG